MDCEFCNDFNSHQDWHDGNVSVCPHGRPLANTFCMRCAIPGVFALIDRRRIDIYDVSDMD